MKRSKKYKQVAEKLEKRSEYSIDEAVMLMPEISLSKFAGSVELEILVNLKEKQKKETVRGSYTLPHAFGKGVKVLVFVDPSNKSKGKDADTVGGEELIEDIEKGKLEFDVVIATPAMMPKIARLGKTLGVKGLMPNPKSGTVTEDIDETVAKFKAGTKNYKMREGGKINLVIGKTDMKADDLVENYQAAMQVVLSELKRFGANPIKSIKLKPTMGKSLKISSN